MEKGPWQVVVERGRSGVTLLAHDGRAQRRWFVGAPEGGVLDLRVRVPRYPVQVRLLETVTLVPGGRLRGYVSVPLPHEVMWRGHNGSPLVVAELLPSGLKTAWVGGEDGYEHRVESRILLDLAGPEGEASAMVPLVLRNMSSQVVSPAEVTVRLRRGDLRQLRRRIVAAPRALVFTGEGEAEELVHGFLGGRA